IRKRGSAISTSLINPPPIFKKYFNDQDRYISYQKKQYRQDDRFFFAEEYNIKCMIRITEFERWFQRIYARPLNVLRDPRYELKSALSAHSKPNFCGTVLVGFDVEKISTNQMYIHKKTKMNIVNQNAMHVARFVQLGFPTGYTIMFDTLAATPEDWTSFYEFVLAPKTIIIGFDQAEDWKCLKDMHGRDYYLPDARKTHSTVLAPTYGRYSFVNSVYDNIQIFPHDFLLPEFIHIAMQNLYDNGNVDCEGDERGTFGIINPTLSKSIKQNTSSLTDDGKIEPYDDAAICARVIGRALHSNDITSIHHAVCPHMSLLFLSEIDQNMVMSDKAKQTNYNLVVNDRFSTYDHPETWPMYEMKSDHQIAETLALTRLYSLPNHHEWMNAVRGTMPLVAPVCSPDSETEL
uniref:Uncharacterized protein n=1 Tax=Romanomermis culicivorax TaxID=13658 RepID=A0A915KXS9_ROMCU